MTQALRSISPSPRADWDAIGDMIRRRRKDLDLDRSDAARRACVSKRTWKRLEDRYAGYVSDEVLIRAADALGIDAAAFLRRCGRSVDAGREPMPHRVVDSARWQIVGDAVHRRRKDLDLDRSEAARTAGLPKAIWKDVEDGYGDSVTPEAVQRVAKALRVDSATLLGEPSGAAGRFADAEARLAAAEARAQQAEARAVEAEARAAELEARV